MRRTLGCLVVLLAAALLWGASVAAQPAAASRNGWQAPSTPAAVQRVLGLAAARKLPSASWADLNVFDRCIARGMPGAMMPGFYNHNYHILQSPGYVVIALEILHDVRVISLDGRPHIAQGIAQWLGDSRGRWEGDTLVVETTNVANKVNEFRRSHTVLGASRHLRLVERFRGSDFRDGDLFVSAFADDAVFNVGQRTISGREELTAYRVERHAGQTGDTGVRHWTNGWRIVPTADGAEARVYWMVVDVGTGKPFTDRSGYYNDTYVKTVDGWRIKNRTINFDRAG